MGNSSGEQDGCGAMALVAVERGGRCPDWARDNSPSTLVIRQEAAETSPEFARRVAHNISGLVREAKQLRRLVLVVTKATDESTDARGAMIRAALYAMAERKAGNIVLSAQDTADDDLRRELFALVGAWSAHLPIGPVLGIRFGEPLHSLRRCAASTGGIFGEAT